MYHYLTSRCCPFRHAFARTSVYTLLLVSKADLLDQEHRLDPTRIFTISVWHAVARQLDR